MCYVEVLNNGEVAIDARNTAGTIHGTLTYVVQHSISPIGSDNSWTVSNKLKEAWGVFGVGGIKPGNNQVDIPLPFTAPDSKALTIMTSLQTHEVENVSYFTDVKIMGIALNTSTIRLIAYNNGSHTVYAQIACHVIAREAYQHSISHTVDNSWHVFKYPDGFVRIVRKATMNVQANERHGEMYYHGYTQQYPSGILSEVLYADVKIARASGLWGTSLQRATTSQLSYYATCSTKQSSVSATLMFLIEGIAAEQFSISPLVKVSTLSKSITVASNNGLNFSIDVPNIDGYLFVGAVGFNSSAWEVCFASLRPNGNTISASVFNNASKKLSATVRINALYVAGQGILYPSFIRPKSKRF